MTGIENTSHHTATIANATRMAAAVSASPIASGLATIQVLKPSSIALPR